MAASAAKPNKGKSYLAKLGTGAFTVTGQSLTPTRRFSVAQSVAFFTGFETGGVSELFNGSLGTSCTIQTTNVRTGGYSLKCASTASNQLIATGIGGTQMVFRFYLFLTGNPAGGNNLWIEQPSAGVNRLGLQISAARKLTIADLGTSLGLTGVNGTTVLNTSQWYRIEVIFDLAAGGVVKLLIDGASEANTTHSNNVSATPFSRFLVNGDTTNPYYFDDIRIDTGGTTAIGAGQIIARQGTNNAGTTPTYNSWTKTGGTTAGANWSETPQSATNNCNTTVSGNAQTMVVDKPSVNPSRAVEGTQVVGSNDTIHAVTVAAVISQPSIVGANANMSWRWRVGGVDTDTTFTLTATAATYYKSPYFTDTPANLDGYQIGLIDGPSGGLTTHTADDVWMMIDYTPNLNTVINLGVGTFTVTGEPLTAPLGHAIALAAGAFALTGEPLTGIRHVLTNLGVGVFSLTGEPLAVGKNTKVSLGAGAFVVTGEPLTSIRHYAASLGTGAFTVTGEPLTVVRHLLANLGTGVFVVTGEGLDPVTALTTGTFLITGQPLSPVVHRVVQLGVGSFAISGKALTRAVHQQLGTGVFQVNSIGAEGAILVAVKLKPQPKPLAPLKPKSKLEQVRITAPGLENWRNKG